MFRLFLNLFDDIWSNKKFLSFVTSWTFSKQNPWFLLRKKKFTQNRANSVVVYSPQVLKLPEKCKWGSHQAQNKLAKIFPPSLGRTRSYLEHWRRSIWNAWSCWGEKKKKTNMKKNTESDEEDKTNMNNCFIENPFRGWFKLNPKQKTLPFATAFVQKKKDAQKQQRKKQKKKNVDSRRPVYL